MPIDKKKVAIGLGIASAISAGIYLYIRQKKVEKLLPSELTEIELQEEVIPGLEQMGEERETDYIMRDPDVVVRQAAMLDQDISAAAGRYLSGVYSEADLDARIAWIAETFYVDEATIREAIDAKIISLDEGTYGKWAAERKAGTTTDPSYTYAHKETARLLEERREAVDDFQATRETGETFRNWQKRTYGEVTYH